MFGWSLPELIVKVKTELFFVISLTKNRKSQIRLKAFFMSSKELKNRLPSPFVSSEIRYNVIIDFCNISVSLGEKL